ncbi:MAG TPA: twin-arginine translocase TatA/TatE family subunit [Sphingomonas sp.]|jgi:sec-independent protein translocase protein TatA|nr:twin-arginine translocase TatA/TatE family subunit [Sphingomonas sp.]
MGSFSLMHWLVLGVIAILLLGGGRFSNMMGDVAKGIKQFKKGMAEDDDDKSAPTRIEGKAAPEPTVRREAEPVREEQR